MADVVMKTGDTGPDYQTTLTDGDSVAVDLTGATVKFLMRRRGSRLTKVNAAATVVTAASGIVKYVWLAADVDEPGLFDAEWEVTFSGGLKESFPNGRYLTVLFTEGLG